MDPRLAPVFVYLKSLVPEFEPADLAPLASFITAAEFRTGAHVFLEGELFPYVTFVRSGLLKKYYATSEGREFIKEFTAEGEVTTPYASQLRSVPATYSMVALEDTSLLLIEYAEIEKLFSRSPKWLALGKAFADLHFLNREDREMELLKHSATERYAVFRTRYDRLLNRIRKLDVAAYIGITPVSLSRLEKSLALNRRRPPR